MNETINGIGSIRGGEYDDVFIEGVGKSKGKVTAHSIRVDGTFKGKGRIQADEIYVEGLARIFRPVRIKKVNVDGLLKLRRAKLEADEITCDGFIISNREISADTVTIDGSCSIARLVGDTITIANKNNGIAESKIPAKIRPFLRLYCGRKVDLEYSLIDEIECTKLEAEKVKAKRICARDVKLGGNCIVDEVDCDGSLEMAPGCVVGKINGKASETKEGAGHMADRTLEKVLEMYKKGSINASEAEQLLKTSDAFTKPADSPVDTPISWEDDDKVRVVVFRGRKLLEKGEAGALGITAELQGDAADVECCGNLKCGNISGSVHAGNSVVCGNIGRNVNCGSDVHCSQIGGNIAAGGGVHIGT